MSPVLGNYEYPNNEVHEFALGSLAAKASGPHRQRHEKVLRFELFGGMWKAYGPGCVAKIVTK